MVCNNNIFNVMNLFQQMQKNPMAVLSQRFNIPQNMNDPQDIIQHLLNTGQVNQQQVNQAMQMRNDPQYRGLFR